MVAKQAAAAARRTSRVASGRMARGEIMAIEGRRILSPAAVRRKRAPETVLVGTVDHLVLVVRRVGLASRPGSNRSGRPLQPFGALLRRTTSTMNGLMIS